MTVISFVVGLSISGQTFYTFILENLDKFGALKAIGAKRLRARRHDPVSGELHGAGRLRPRHRPLRAVIALAKLRLPDYAAVITLRESGPRVRHGASSSPASRATSPSARCSRSSPSTSSEADDAQDRDPRRRAREVVRRGRRQDVRRAGRELRRVLRRDALHRRPVGQRQDDAAQHHLRHPAAERGHRDRRGHGHLAARRRIRWPTSGCTRSASSSRTITCSRG